MNETVQITRRSRSLRVGTNSIPTQTSYGLVVRPPKTWDTRRLTPSGVLRYLKRLSHEYGSADWNSSLFVSGRTVVGLCDSNHWGGVYDALQELVDGDLDSVELLVSVDEDGDDHE